MTKPLVKIVLWLGIILGAFIASPVFADHEGFNSNGIFYVYAHDANGDPDYSQPATPRFILNGTTGNTPLYILPENSGIPQIIPRDLFDNSNLTGHIDYDIPSAAGIPTATPEAIRTATGSLLADSDFQETLRGRQNDDFGLNCGFGGVGGYFSHCIPIVGYGLFYIPAVWIVKISGYIFDALLAFSLSGQMIGQQSFVEDGWTVVRNISNLVFIFFLLYIAIKTILGLGDWKKSVVPVIIVALLINFSLFFTKIIIDASNILAYQFYNNIGAASTSPIINEGTIGFAARDISQHLVSRINPQALANLNSYADWEALGGTVYTLFFFFLATGIILIAIAYVLFKAAFLFLGRLIAFWFLMIFSPLAFLGFAFPQAQKITGEWTKKLTDQALVAPVFLFFLYMVSIIVDSGVYDIQMGQSATDTTMVLVMIVLKTAVFVGLMLYALKTTKDLSGEFGSTVTSYVGKTAGFALGGAAFAGRHTVGRAASKLVDENTERGKKFRDWASRSRMGEMTFKATKDLGGATFDARNTKLGKTLDMDFGKGGGKGGYQKMLDNQVKDRKEFVKELAKGRDGEEADKIKEQYATRMTSPSFEAFGVPFRDTETLFTKTARKNKEAAKQIMKDVDKSRNTRNVKANKEEEKTLNVAVKKLEEEYETLKETPYDVRQRLATGQGTPEDNAREKRKVELEKTLEEKKAKLADLRKKIEQGEKETKKQALKEAVTDVSKELDSEKPAPESTPAEGATEKK